MAHERRGDATGALGWYEKAHAGDPYYFPAYVNSAKARLSLGDLSGAASQMEGALRIEPGSVEVAANLAGVRMSQGKYVEALEEFSMLAARYPQAAEFMEAKGDALLALGRSREAASAYTDALRVLPSLQTARAKLEMITSGR